MRKIISMFVVFALSLSMVSVAFAFTQEQKPKGSFEIDVKYLERDDPMTIKYWKDQIHPDFDVQSEYARYKTPNGKTMTFTRFLSDITCSHGDDGGCPAKIFINNKEVWEGIICQPPFFMKNDGSVFYGCFKEYNIPNN